MANKSYFRIVQTVEKNGEGAGQSAETKARTIHEQKLNNYVKYKQPWTDAEIADMPKGDNGEPLNRLNGMPLNDVPDFKIHHVNTCTTSKNFDFIMTTTFCCEDEDEEAGEKY